ncbi:3-deoxy-D-manno-octulosonic-acid transferase [Mucilaginibacter gracilis]|uniref:3-deoxy-D-manno-octulosonic acid transferase n=1 Tax=Mucilaginibacter gracilis TaxID=423350 RepID=A0A495J8L6_9SPHI|nr:glycosyltransferase N-terminal domain-containing protein [Mucilaginibacter gracilis]RKR85335.1 3-deoxy-D-manno-octulosonic-acid transferase [Mucilaginibacter gracilis]
MLLLYNCFIRLYYILIFFVSFFNKKAKLLLNGWLNNNFNTYNQSIWFHFASLGEFEQGRPVLEKMRLAYPSYPIVVTFFSPSGYEVRKNTQLANAVYYLPLDTAKNAKEFIETINPVIAVFTKYEYWYHYFNELNKRSIPLYMVSAIFRPKQVFFKWYGALHRKMLTLVTHLFVQDNESKLLLQNIGINHTTVSGDTRFDRVWQNAKNPAHLPLIEQFKNNKPVFIGGSTWPEDEKLIAELVPLHAEWKFIIAPHEITEDKILALVSMLPQNEVIRFSEIKNMALPLGNFRVLIIDNIGMLSSLYQYGEIAFIGGGFGAGIHNTLEAAAFGLPVIIGPKFQNFREARDIIKMKLGFTVNNLTDLKPIADKLINDNAYRQKIGADIKTYVEDNTGATQAIINVIRLKG